MPGITVNLNQDGVSKTKEHPESDYILYGLHHADGIAGAGRLDDRSVDLLLADPTKSGRGVPDMKEWTDTILPKVRGWCVIFCNQGQIGQYNAILKRHGFSAVGPMVWYHNDPLPAGGRQRMLDMWEAAVVGKRPGTKFNGRSVHNVFECGSVSPDQRIHPDQKPIQLIERLIWLFTDKGDTILDPFAGSATTLLVAEWMSRKCMAFEIDLSHYMKATIRLENAGIPDINVPKTRDRI